MYVLGKVRKGQVHNKNKDPGILQGQKCKNN
jgi:hypothetical protein